MTTVNDCMWVPPTEMPRCLGRIAVEQDRLTQAEADAFYGTAEAPRSIGDVIDTLKAYGRAQDAAQTALADATIVESMARRFTLPASGSASSGSALWWVLGAAAVVGGVILWKRSQR